MCRPYKVFERFLWIISVCTMVLGVNFVENLIDSLDMNATEKKLTYALLDLMKKKPFEKIHVNEICSLSNVHRTTFYKYFSDKYELLDLCVKGIENLIMYNSGDGENSASYKDYYMNATEKILEIMLNNREIFKALLSSSENAPIAQEIIKGFEKNIVREITKHSAINERLSSADIPPELFAVFYAGGCMAAASWWLSSESELSPKEMVSYLEKMIIGA